MKNKWAYLGLNICWLLSLLYAYTGATVCDRLSPDFETGAVFGMSMLLSRLLGALGFLFLYFIIKNNHKRERRKHVRKNN